MPQGCPASQSSERNPHLLPHQYHQPGEPLPASSLLGLPPEASQTDEINTMSQSMPAARLAVSRTLALPSSEIQGDPLQQSWRSNVPSLSPIETLSFDRPSQSLAGTAVAGRRLQGPPGAETGAHGLAAAAVLAPPAAGSQGERRVTAGTASPLTSSRSRAPEQVGWTHTSDPNVWPLASRGLTRPDLTGLTEAGRPSRCGARLQTDLVVCIISIQAEARHLPEVRHLLQTLPLAQAVCWPAKTSLKTQGARAYGETTCSLCQASGNLLDHLEMLWGCTRTRPSPVAKLVLGQHAYF